MDRSTSRVAVTNDKNRVLLEIWPRCYICESLYSGGSSVLAFPLPPSQGICLILNKPIHWSDHAEMYLQAPLDKSSEKFAIFNVKMIPFHSSLLSAECWMLLIEWIFLPLCCLLAQKMVISRSLRFCCYCKLGQREERRGKYLSSDVILGQSTLINREIQSQLFSI